ncbi:MAG: UvrD-helicase domain-containing protein [bacterium]
MNIKEYECELSLKNPTPDQLTVIKEDLPLSVTAGAGSGKTKVLVDKIINILSEDENTELNNFSIITFTNKATKEMKKNLKDRLYYEWARREAYTGNNTLKKNKCFWRKQLELIEMTSISTIHKFCEGIIRDYGLIINQPTNFKIRSVKDFLNKTSNKILNKYTDRSALSDIKLYRLQDYLLKFFNDNENRGIEIDRDYLHQLDINGKNDTDWEEVLEVFFLSYIELQYELKEYKKKNNILTSNDLIKYAVKIITQKNDYALTRLTIKYKYLFIDEFQDTNLYQYELVKRLKERGVGIFVVGDDKQSIYRFRGADIKSFRRMTNASDVISKNMTMYDNFRTDENLLNIINNIFDGTFFKDDDGRMLEFNSEKLKPQISNNRFDIPFRVAFNDDLDNVINYLVEHEDDVNYNDIAILYRSNWDLNEAAKYLKEKRIPIEVVGGKGFYSSKPIIEMYKLFYYIFNKDINSKNELKYTDYYISYNKYNTGDFNVFLEELSKRFRFMSVQSLLEYIYSSTRLKDYYLYEKLYQEYANLEKLKEISVNAMDKDFIQPIQFLNYLNMMIESEKEEDEADVPDSIKEGDGVVSLISIHKAKGLEYPIVIIPKIEKELVKPSIEPKIIFDYDKKRIAFSASKLYGIHKSSYNNRFENKYLEENRDPDYEQMNVVDKKEMLEEELRILYVALTRPKNMLVLLGDERPKPKSVCWANWINSSQGILDRYIYNFK